MGLLVVAYDVADDRRRVRLHTLLMGYGEAVQESVFECVVDEAAERALRRRVRRIARAGVDRVRFYPICGACARRIVDADGAGRRAEPLVWVAD